LTTSTRTGVVVVTVALRGFSETSREAELVGERRDLAQLALGAAREQRHLAQQLELRVLAQSHSPILTSVESGAQA
jgi:hypothetical protein